MIIEGATVTQKRQLLRRSKDEETGESRLDTSPPKSGRKRTFEISPGTVALLKEHKLLQSEIKLKRGCLGEGSDTLADSGSL